MKKLKLNEIIELLEELGITPRDFYDEEVSYMLSEALQSTDEQQALAEQVGKVIPVTNGLQDDYNAYEVFYFPAHDVYMKLVGEFDSYKAIQNFEEWGTEVRPKEVTKTVYE
jgi:hypothetical protein